MITNNSIHNVQYTSYLLQLISVDSHYTPMSLIHYCYQVDNSMAHYVVDNTLDYY